MLSMFLFQGTRGCSDSRQRTEVEKYSTPFLDGIRTSSFHELTEPGQAQ